MSAPRLRAGSGKRERATIGDLRVLLLPLSEESAGLSFCEAMVTGRGLIVVVK